MTTFLTPNTYIKRAIQRLTLKQRIFVAIVLVSIFILMCQLMMWYIAALLLVLWTPCSIKYTHYLIKKDTRLAIYFVFLALQSIHMFEHIAQMVQIHLLFKAFNNSHGLFGAYLDVEWLHFFFDSLYIPLCTIWLLMLYNSRDKWLLILLPLALWHCAEHVVIMNYYLKTHIVGSPGILAHGGLIGSPISRPDLHFLYNLVEETFIVLGFRKQLHRRRQTI